MDRKRREFLKLSGSAITTGAVFGAGVAAGGGDPADEFDGAHYSNYDSANRTAADVNWIVVHTTAGSYQSAVNRFKNPDGGASAHYVIRKDGFATKMVNFDDVAQHTIGFDDESIGIEHEWYRAMGPVTDATIRKSAEIVDYLCDRFGIARRLVGPQGPCKYDSGIIRHEHAPTNASCSDTNATLCPEEYDFDKLLNLIGDGGGGGGGDRAPVLPFDTGTDLTRRVEVTASELDDAVDAVSPGSPLVGLGDVWMEMQDRYQINAVYQAAHAAHESGWGRSEIARTKNNIYGYDAKTSCPQTCANGYDSFEHCVRVVVPIIHDEYLTDGGDHYYGTSLNAMNVQYADDKGSDTPPGDPLWWKDKIVETYRDIAAELPGTASTAGWEQFR